MSHAICIGKPRVWATCIAFVIATPKPSACGNAAMFSIHGLTGQALPGNLGHLLQVPGASAARASEPLNMRETSDFPTRAWGRVIPGPLVALTWVPV